MKNFLLLFLALFFSAAHAGHIGNILVVDPAYSRVVEYDFESGQKVRNFIAPQLGFDSPQGAAIGADFKFYVADSTDRTIKRFDAYTGAFLNNFITTPGGASPVYSLTAVTAIKFVGNALYVLANAPTRLLKFHALTGAFIKTIFTAASTSQFRDAKDFIFLDNLSRVLVVGTTNKGARYDVATGAFVDYFLNPTGVTTDMQDPYGVAFGPDGRIWVSSSNNKVLRYNATTGALVDNNFLKGGPLNRPSQILFEMETDAVYVLSRGMTSATVSRFSMTSGYARDDAPFIDGGAEGPISPRYMLFARTNQAPVAYAGPDKSVTSGESVSFNGGASFDPDGDFIYLSWTQVSGPAVVMASNYSAWASFTAPVVTVPTTLVFQVTATDGEFTSTDTVQVLVTPINLDRDNDGMPNDWETANGFDPDNGNDAALDADSDGQKNVEEYVAGTNPRDSSSSLKILSTAVVDGKFVVRFTSRSDRIYGTQESSDLQTWSGSLNEVVGQNGETTIERPMTGSRRSYRIGVRQMQSN